MSKILFSHSYYLSFDSKQWELGLPYAPLGTLYAASVMREKGHDVSVSDVMFAPGPEIIADALEREPDFFVLYEDGFNYLTKMCLTNMREAAFKMIALAKQRNCIVIVSSSDSTDHFEMYLDKGADFVLIGEAEQTLSELVESINNKENDFSAIQGVAYKKNTSVIKTQKRNVIRDLDSLPLPAWDLIDIAPYKQKWLKNAGYFSINVGTTRGCPYKCNWCAKPIYGNRYNARSPENVIREVQMLKQRFDIDHVWFCDDIFGLKPGWVNEFADLVKQHSLFFKFKIQSRADLLLQENYVAALAKAGCDNVWMGAESGSQKILDAMDKGTTVEQIGQSTKLLKAYNIKPSFFIQFGYPGETMQDIRLTIKMINKNLPHEIGISVSYPLPGTPFYEKVKGQLKDKSNWTDSDDLALMFSNTYKPAFYKQLHRYVHKNYRKHLAFENLTGLLKNPLKIDFYVLKKILSGLYYIPASLFEKMKLSRLEKTL